MGKAVLDKVDNQILAALRANGRESQVSIARRVGLSRSAVQERIARLERDGVIVGYTVRLREQAAPGVQAYMLVSIEGPNHERTVARLVGIPEVKSCASLSGEVDFLLRVEAESFADLNRVRDQVGAIATVRRTNTLLVMASRFDRD